MHGLFTFIREDPYMERQWFVEALFKPFISGSQRHRMAEAVSRVLWRTSKKHVEAQINIPKLTEVS